ncbi:uncharacterized protein LOC133825379 [Humulus lupulus]|uniref:uncharacterized protein LOC133825379 n=1 Tax=Humulus lupulus TaxID=3486 RepID=UPI002B40A272|nr:uncharacterized protein LOC133825379 [Humulus lupulus]
MGDLRPMPLFNVLYKVAYNVFANRLKGVLNDVISDSQSGFIRGWLITDNVMVSFEILHYLKRKTKGRNGYMTLKLDMSKGYDRVDWPFLCASLAAMGFGDHWIRLVDCFFRTVRYKIWCGGKEVGPIVSGIGIRQASEREASYVMDLLEKFEGASGQKVNSAMSYVFFSPNYLESTKISICKMMGIQKVGRIVSIWDYQV